MDDMDSLTPAYHHGHPLLSGWRRLTGAEERGVWDRFRLTSTFNGASTRNARAGCETLELARYVRKPAR